MQLTGDIAHTSPCMRPPGNEQARAVQHRQPLSPEDFERCMAPLGPFEHQPSLAIAVSGGPDSLALTMLAARWAKRRGGYAVGLTVDHGLRPGSADEARQTASWLEAHGIEHHILTWQGPKPSSNVQQLARNARYDRMAAWCRGAGFLHLLTAHHRQDQAETVALRKARQSGPDGLAAMAPIRELRGLRLLRPLLAVDKARLTATLQALGQCWLDDPSNRNLRFTRNRLRQDGLDTASLADEATMWGEQRSLSDQRLSACLARHATIDPTGFASLPATAFRDHQDDLALAMLERLLMTIGGGIYPPRRKRLLRLFREMRLGSPFRGRTLAHCRVLISNGRWLFCREAAPLEPLRLSPGIWQRWDNRFAVRLRNERPGLVMQMLDEHGAACRNNLIEKSKTRNFPAVVRPTLPSVWQDRRLVAVPHLGLFDPSFEPSELDLHFRPPIPLAKAPFINHKTSQSDHQTVALTHRYPMLRVERLGLAAQGALDK